MLKISLALVLAAAIGLSGWHFIPIFKPFPKPTGTYPVGLTTLELQDTDRKEQFSDNPEDARGLVIRIYYPATLTTHAKRRIYLEKEQPYIVPFIVQLLAANYHINIPHWLAAKMISNIHTYAYQEVPVSDKQKNYPVILISHGLLGSIGAMYAAISEEVASHGYMVISIDHSYLSLLTVFPNGKVITSQKLNQKFQKLSAQEQYDFTASAIEIYKKDVQFVLDQLALINEDPESIVYHHLDLDRIGVMGHSAGGTTAIEISKIDKRVKAAIDLDGWYENVISYDPIPVPLLLMFGSKSIEVTEPSQEYLTRKGITKEQYYDREKKIAAHKEELCQKSKDCQMIIIPNASHGDFGDFALAKWPLGQWNSADSYTLKLINTHIVKFFDQHLN